MQSVRGQAKDRSAEAGQAKAGMPEPSLGAIVPVPQGGQLAVLPAGGNAVAAEVPSATSRSAVMANLINVAAHEPMLVSYYMALTRDRTTHASPWASLQQNIAEHMRFHMQSIEDIGRKYATRMAASMMTHATTEEQIATWDSPVVRQLALPAPATSTDVNMGEDAVEEAKDEEEDNGDVEIPDWDFRRRSLKACE